MLKNEELKGHMDVHIRKDFGLISKEASIGEKIAFYEKLQEERAEQLRIKSEYNST